MTYRPNRSDQYQYVLLEISCSNEMMEGVPTEQGLLAQEQYNDELMDLREQLRKEFWKLVDHHMTDNQRKILHLYADGYTQMEIAKVMNVNRSSIAKSLNGNIDYKNGKKVYGGSHKKLKRLAEQNPCIRKILQRIQEINEEKW